MCDYGDGKSLTMVNIGVNYNGDRVRVEERWMVLCCLLSPAAVMLVGKVVGCRMRMVV